MPPPCIQRITHSVIKLDGERTSIFYLDNSSQRAVLRHELDGCVHPEGNICDWLVMADDVTPCLHVFVELKGHDYRAAMVQLTKALLAYPAAIDEPTTRCYIVGTGFPKFSTRGQVEADKFEKRFRVQLFTKHSGDTVPL